MHIRTRIGVRIRLGTAEVVIKTITSDDIIYMGRSYSKWLNFD